MPNLNAIKARLGSLSSDMRTRLAGISPAAFHLIAVDLPALIAAVEVYEQKEAPVCERRPRRATYSKL